MTTDFFNDLSASIRLICVIRVPLTTANNQKTTGINYSLFFEDFSYEFEDFYLHLHR
jgi:hypothetical protein